MNITGHVSGVLKPWHIFASTARYLDEDVIDLHREYFPAHHESHCIKPYYGNHRNS